MKTSMAVTVEVKVDVAQCLSRIACVILLLLT